MQLGLAAGCAYIGWHKLKRHLSCFMDPIMKLIVPFDNSISPPKRFWSALFRPGVQAQNPEAEFGILRHTKVPGPTRVLMGAEERPRVRNAKALEVWVQMKRAFGALGKWFARRDAQEAEEQLAASRGLEDLERVTRLRGAERIRYLRS
jgi:hypothetical protein